MQSETLNENNMPQTPKRRAIVLPAADGFIAGILAAAAAVWLLMPGGEPKSGQCSPTC